MTDAGGQPTQSETRKRRWLLARRLAAAVIIVCCAIAWRDTMADPVVKRTEVMLEGLPPGTPPIRVVLMSDLHVIAPDMPPERLARIVAQVNTLKPDLVAIAGDFVSDRWLATRHYSIREAVAPLAALKARMGVVAVLGNHDHWRNGVLARAELARVGVVVLSNESVERGPLTIGGLDDYATRHDRPRRLMASVPPTHRALVVVSHHPDVFQWRTQDVPLVLAGHFHCGQIAWPWGGTPAHTSDWDDRYTCNRTDKGSRTLVVTGGLGNSNLPFRFLVPPDIYLVTLRPKS